MRDLTESQTAWLAALRSGMFVQGISSMKRVGRDGKPTTHCCMGVACEVLGYVLVPDHPSKYRMGVAKADITSAMSGDEDSPPVAQSILPDVVNDRLNLDHADDQALAQMNDNGWSFANIAELCEFAWTHDRRVAEVYQGLMDLKVKLLHLSDLDPNG